MSVYVHLDLAAAKRVLAADDEIICDARMAIYSRVLWQPTTEPARLRLP